MKSTLLWALAILNAVLLATFIGRVTPHNMATAAEPMQNRRMGDYLTLSGEVEGGPGGVVYVLDTSNDLLGAMAYDDSRNTIDVMPVIDLKRVFEQPAPARK
jgi:hypothetical protein